MKKIFIAITAIMLTTQLFAQETAVQVPSGYQGFLEQGPSYRFNDDGNTSVSFSTTHGFYFSDNAFVGVGVALEGGNDFFAAPFYTALKYNFSYKHKVTPTLQLRLGSYLSESVGAYADFAFGLRFGSSRDFAINFMLTATYFSKYEDYDYYDSSIGQYVRKNMDPSSIGLRIGIEW